MCQEPCSRTVTEAVFFFFLLELQFFLLSSTVCPVRGCGFETTAEAAKQTMKLSIWNMCHMQYILVVLVVGSFCLCKLDFEQFVYIDRLL